VGEDRDAAQDRVTIQEAAQRLGVKEDAIRKRIQRGTLRHEKTQEGRVFVWLDAAPDATQDAAQDTYRDASQDALLSAKDETIAALREQLAQANERDRENRRIIAALTTRFPEIEPPRPEPEPERPINVRPPPPPGLVQQAGTTVMTTVVGQATLAAFSAFSLLKGNIRLVVLLGVGQVLLLVGTFLYVRRQSRLTSIPLPGEPSLREEPSRDRAEPSAEAPPAPSAPSPVAYRLVVFSMLTAAVVFIVTLAAFAFLGSGTG
jgi:excisionase family DNA binding protein